MATDTKRPKDEAVRTGLILLFFTTGWILGGWLVFVVQAPQGRQPATEPAAAASELGSVLNRASLALIVAPLPRSGPIDEGISVLQDQVRQSPGDQESIIKLGWLFVSRARVTGETRYCQLATHCALFLESLQPASDEALILRAAARYETRRSAQVERLVEKLIYLRGEAEPERSGGTRSGRAEKDSLL